MNKNKFYTLLLGLFLVTTLSAQQHNCGTVHTEEFMQRLEANVKYSKTNLTRMYETRYVPIAFHLVGDSQGEGRLPEETVYEQLGLINHQFDSLGFVFYLHSINLLNNSAVFEHVGNYTGTMINSKVPNAMNVYLVNNVFEGAGGYYSPFGDFIGIPKDFFIRTDNVPFSHEVGHFLSIAHPHVGWEDAPYDPNVHGDRVTVTQVGSSQTGGTVAVELQNGSNCNTAGDRICDTPPDYGFMQAANSCNNPWEGIVKDRNDDLIFTLPDLYMTYNGYACNEYAWTHGQATAMMSDYDLRNNLNKTYVPDTLQITEIPTLLSPEPFSTVETYNNVLIEWEPVTNAHGYILKIGFGADIVVKTTETQHLLTNLESGQNYTYIVYPINEVGYRLGISSTNLFSTGSTTSTNEIEGVEAITVFPNPIKNSDEINLSMELEREMDLSIDLISSTGQVIKTWNKVEANAGNFHFTMDATGLSTGVYFIQLSSNEGTLVQRVMVTE